MTKFKRYMAAVLHLSNYRKRSVPLDFSSGTYCSPVRQDRAGANFATTADSAGQSPAAVSGGFLQSSFAKHLGRSGSGGR